MGDIPEWGVHVTDILLSELKQRDPYTFYHCCRVGRSARRLAQAMGLNEYDQFRLEFAGLFHDVGKMGIPLAILNKPTRLSKDEFFLMQSHVKMSALVVGWLGKEHNFFQSLINPILYHHERVDGQGYQKIDQRDIPLESKIISVVDTVDAMLHTRAYRKALDFETIKEELIECSGQQFDKDVVKIYLQAVRFWKDIKIADKEEMIIGKLLPVAA